MCDGPVAVTHNILHWMGWHWQALRKGGTTCWMDRKAGSFMKSGRDCVLQKGRK